MKPIDNCRKLTTLVNTVQNENSYLSL